MEEFEEASGEERKISKYNSAIAQLIRLDALWKKTHEKAINGDLDKWNWVLDRIWLENIGDLDKKNQEDRHKIQEYQRINRDIANIKTNLFNRRYKVIEFRSKMYQKLMEKEAFLRKVQNFLGKGTAWGDEDEDEFD